MRLTIHSVVDMITNSSTTVYNNCHDNTIDYMKDIINAILKEAGSDKTADDLFEITIGLDNDARAEAAYQIRYMPSLAAGMDGVEEISLEKAEEIVAVMPDDAVKRVLKKSYDTREDGLLLTVKSKSGCKNEIISKIGELFDTDAYFNG